MRGTRVDLAAAGASGDLRNGGEPGLRCLGGK